MPGPCATVPLAWLCAGVILLAAAASPVEGQTPDVPNHGFEALDPATGFAQGWIRGLGPGTNGSAEMDSTVARTGARSLRITDATPNQAYRYVLVNTDWLKVRPESTYVLRFYARGRKVGKCFAGIAFDGAGEHRQPVPAGDYDWREVRCRFTTPVGNGRIRIMFAADDIAEGLWIDDVTLEVSPVQLANIKEQRPAGKLASWYPRSTGVVPRRLAVLDVSRESADVRALATALQGIVNRRSPRLYLINPTNPPGYDEMWLQYVKDKGYTGREERLPSVEAALKRFGSAIRGAVVWDPELPGSRHAAWMLAGLKDALPASPNTAARLRLPVVEDLRGRWRRNVDAYRYVMERYWPRMNPRLLAWEHPLSDALTSRDVMVQHRAFLFWVSAPTDNEKGADPVAEMEFLEELLSRTPGNVPVMGWPMYGTKGIEEYTGVRLLSEFGKWVPGTQFNSNGSVLSAIRPAASVFAQRRTAPTPALDPTRLYLSVNILDSGDAHWYWQFHQRTIWADPLRGSVPTGYGMNMTLLDALPVVAQWYYEHRKPGDTFFGLIYMNAPVYAARFRKEDRERIWAEYVGLTARYMKRLNMEGLDVYTGGTGGPSAPAELLRRFTRGIPGLRYMLAGLGRHSDIRPDNAATLLDGVVVFHTLTNFRVWSLNEDLRLKKMADENAWLLSEIEANAPASRPGFVSAMAISWIYRPSWLKDLHDRLPPDYVMVGPGDLARLYRAAHP